VQELRFQLQQTQAAAAIAAEQHKRDIAKQLQKQAADTVARQQVRIVSEHPSRCAATEVASGFSAGCTAPPLPIGTL
jgi:hypothetical protein